MRLLVINKDIANKSGYNLFRVFADDYLGMEIDLSKKSIIKLETYLLITKDMLYNFFCSMVL